MNFVKGEFFSSLASKIYLGCSLVMIEVYSEFLDESFESKQNLIFFWVVFDKKSLTLLVLLQITDFSLGGSFLLTFAYMVTSLLDSLPTSSVLVQCTSRWFVPHLRHLNSLSFFFQTRIPDESYPHICIYVLSSKAFPL